MDYRPELEDVTLKAVERLNKDLGKGSYATVFTVKYDGEIFAAKMIHPLLIEHADSEEREIIKNDFIQECLCLSSLRHSSIVQFKGVYYDEAYDPAKPHTLLPIMVMELMHTSLTNFVREETTNISSSEKISILHDVSEGLRFLHGHKPQIIHRDLTSNNILLTVELVAKIGDLGIAKVMQDGSRKTKLKMTPGVYGTPDFMPPEVTPTQGSVYGTSMDVFSFGAITLHLFSEEWPSPCPLKIKDPATEQMIALSEVERRKKYLDKMSVICEAVRLREIVEKCLHDDPDKRPTIKEVSRIIELLKDVKLHQEGAYQLLPPVSPYQRMPKETTENQHQLLLKSKSVPLESRENIVATKFDGTRKLPPPVSQRAKDKTGQSTESIAAAQFDGTRPLTPPVTPRRTKAQVAPLKSLKPIPKARKQYGMNTGNANKFDNPYPPMSPRVAELKETETESDKPPQKTRPHSYSFDSMQHGACAAEAVTLTPPVICRQTKLTGEPAFTQSTEDDKTTKLRQIITELIDTEIDYIKKLDHVRKNYVVKMETLEGIPGGLVGKKNILFSNIEILHRFNEGVFLPKLQKVKQFPMKLGQVFIDNEEQLINYSWYFKNMPAQKELMNEIGTVFFAPIQKSISDPFSLAENLLYPFQRMTQYSLLLKRMIESSDPAAEGYDELKRADKIINFVLHHGNNMLAVESLNGFNGSLVEQGLILYQGDLTLIKGFTSSKKRVFLFENLIIVADKVTHRDGKESYTYKESYRTNEMTLRGNITSHPKRFKLDIILSNGKRHTSLFQAESGEEKAKWIDYILDLLMKQMKRLKDQQEKRRLKASPVILYHELIDFKAKKEGN